MNENPTDSNKYFYNKFLNRVVSEQRKEKRSYFLKYFEKNKTNMKKLWIGIKSIVNVKAKNYEALCLSLFCILNICSIF